MCKAQRRKDNQKRDERFTHQSKPSQSPRGKPHKDSSKKEINPIAKEGKHWCKKPKENYTARLPLEDEDLEDAAHLQRTLDDSEDSDYKKPENYGHSETLTTDDDTEDSELG